MPTILASAVLTKVKTILQDTTNVRWADTELLGWLNDGQREIAMLRPDSTSKISSVQLVSGTKQAIPADGTSILKVIRNMGASPGTTPGQALRLIPMDLLDSNVPAWHSATAAPVVLHYMTDQRMPRNFYVYPPATGTTFAEILYSAAPTDLTLVSSTIGVDDVYAGPLIDYVAFRAYAKDQDMAGNTERAAAHRALFENVMGGKAQADGTVKPSQVNIKG